MYLLIFTHPLCLNFLLFLLKNISWAMNRERSAEGGSSEGDRTFDFKYKIDISDRKGKTGQTFKMQEGFDFDDFKDFRQDKSQKSFITSQRKVLPSQLVKKSEESFVITQNPTQISIKKKGGSFFADDIKHIATEQQQFVSPSQAVSPKFNNHKISRTVTNNMFSKTGGQQVFNLPRSKIQSKFSMPQQMSANINMSKRSDEQQSLQKQKYASPQMPQPSYQVSSSRQRPNLSSRISPELQYKDLLASIQYYQNENDKLDYQTTKILQQISRYQKLIEQNPSHQYELAKLTDQTNILNSRISTQRSLQRTLIQNHKRLQQQFDQMVMSMEGLKFQRPTIIKDEAKAIIDEINACKAQFQSLKRQQGSLNLSNTLQNPLTSLQNRALSFIPQQGKLFNPEQAMFKQSISQILQYGKNQPNYITNIKMMAMKDEWNIFQNAQICVNCCTRDYPMLQLRIGNKSAKNLTDFILREESAVIADRQTLQSKSYFRHSHRLMKISQPFLRITLSYRAKEKQDIKNYLLYIPILPIKHGQFIPITKKQYQQESNQHKNYLQQLTALDKPIDTAIIKQNITQFLLFYPNLLQQTNQNGQTTLKGLFKLWNSSQGSLVKIKQKGNTVSIYIKNNITFLLQSLQFLLTTII